MPDSTGENTPPSAPGSPSCPWCSNEVQADAERCPTCGATLTDRASSLAEPIPGVTAVAPELREYEQRATQKKPRPTLLSIFVGEPEQKAEREPAPSEPVDRMVLRPPSPEVRAAMDRLDQEIAAAGLGDSSPLPPSPIEADRPSQDEAAVDRDPTVPAEGPAAAADRTSVPDEAETPVSDRAPGV
jgi:hypothetical protein